MATPMKLPKGEKRTWDTHQVIQGKRDLEVPTKLS